jgi:two-component system LytT family response regulator
MTYTCMIVDDEPLARARVRRMLARAGDFEVVAELEDAVSAIEAIHARPPDLLFLDVHMPELDGFGLLASLDAEVLPAVIFTTAHDEHAVRAFEENAIDYLLKPFTAARFQTALARARSRIGAREGGAALRKIIAVREGGGLRLVRADEIDWIEAADNYVVLHAGGREHLHREPLAALAARLGARFARIHRRTAVNLDRVKELVPLVAGDFEVVLEGGARLRLSRTYRRELEERLGVI